MGYDGFRILAYSKRGTVRLGSREGRLWDFIHTHENDADPSAKLAQDFDESEHPRDERRRFADRGSAHGRNTRSITFRESGCGCSWEGRPEETARRSSVGGPGMWERLLLLVAAEEVKRPVRAGDAKSACFRLTGHR